MELPIILALSLAGLTISSMRLAWLHKHASDEILEEACCFGLCVMSGLCAAFSTLLLVIE